MDLCSMMRGAYMMLEERLSKHQEPQRGYVREHIAGPLKDKIMHCVIGLGL